MTAFGSTCRADIDPADDPQIGLLIEAKTPVVTIFGKSWDLHVTEVLRTNLEENLRMIRDSVATSKSHDKRWSTTPSTSSTATAPILVCAGHAPSGRRRRCRQHRPL
ncbi:MAG: hypothetical protein R3A10_23310 [Caldilineaceae bacterium]